MKLKPLQIILIAGTIVLTIGLSLAPSQVNQKPNGLVSKEKKKATNAEFEAEELLKSASKALTKEQTVQLDFLQSGLKGSGSKDTAVLDQLGRFWDRLMIPAASAIWFERKASVQPSSQNYLDAAYRYFDSFKVAQDSGLRSLLVAKAILNYEKVLEIDPNNLNAKTDLGACYAEGTDQPMKGILLLREVVAANPEHEMAQYNLGMLSVKSGQLDKAIERFNKVIEINPKRSELYYFLGQIYLQKQDTSAALKNFKAFMKSSKDYEMVTQVGKIVESIQKPS
jgi:tetratricopeptide (TPR) repeat protein